MTMTGNRVQLFICYLLILKRQIYFTLVSVFWRTPFTLMGVETVVGTTAAFLFALVLQSCLFSGRDNPLWHKILLFVRALATQIP